MKVRKFYPRQVLRKLQGDHIRLDDGQFAAVKYAALKGRKLGMSLFVGSTADRLEILAAASSETVQAVIENATTRIVLNGSLFSKPKS